MGCESQNSKAASIVFTTLFNLMSPDVPEMGHKKKKIMQLYE